MSIVYPSRCFRCVTVAIYLISHFNSVFQFKIPLHNEPQNKRGHQRSTEVSSLLTNIVVKVN